MISSLFHVKCCTNGVDSSIIGSVAMFASRKCGWWWWGRENPTARRQRVLIPLRKHEAVPGQRCWKRINPEEVPLNISHRKKNRWADQQTCWAHRGKCSHYGGQICVDNGWGKKMATESDKSRNNQLDRLIRTGRWRSVGTLTSGRRATQQATPAAERLGLFHHFDLNFFLFHDLVDVRHRKASTCRFL